MADYRLHDRQRNSCIGGKGDEGVPKGVERRLGRAGSSPFYLHARLDIRRLEDQLQPVADSPLAVLVPVGERGFTKAEAENALLVSFRVSRRRAFVSELCGKPEAS